MMRIESYSFWETLWMRAYSFCSAVEGRSVVSWENSAAKSRNESSVPIMT